MPSQSRLNMKAKKINDIDIGLDALCRLADPFQTLKAGEIAEVCGCSRTRIYEIEQAALKKLKVRAMRKNLQDFLRD